MGKVTCFLIEPVHLGKESLRRFVFSTEAKCSGRLGYHSVSKVIAPVVPHKPDGHYGQLGDLSHDDPRWPTHCECGYAFKPDDQWQHNLHQLYARTGAEESELWSIDEVPAGAMWDAKGWWDIPTLDGHVWVVRLPCGTDWMVDGDARGGGKWTRSGVAPRLTVRPSILTSGYHGFLTDGVLIPV